MHVYRRTDSHAKLLGTSSDCVNTPKGPMVVAIYRKVYAYVLLRIKMFHR
jgi:hypothetical protein